jgi:hypothetical protein
VKDRRVSRCSLVEKPSLGGCPKFAPAQETSRRTRKPSRASAFAWNRKASVIPLAADRIRASSGRRVPFGATRSWERGIVEGPWMHKRNSTYYLFYSGGNWTDASYHGEHRVAHMLSGSPGGPRCRPAPRVKPTLAARKFASVRGGCF